MDNTIQVRVNISPETLKAYCHSLTKANGSNTKTMLNKASNAEIRQWLTEHQCSDSGSRRELLDRVAHVIEQHKQLNEAPIKWNSAHGTKINRMRKKKHRSKAEEILSILQDMVDINLLEGLELVIKLREPLNFGDNVLIKEEMKPITKGIISNRINDYLYEVKVDDPKNGKSIRVVSLPYLFSI